MFLFSEYSDFIFEYCIILWFKNMLHHILRSIFIGTKTAAMTKQFWLYLLQLSSLRFKRSNFSSVLTEQECWRPATKCLNATWRAIILFISGNLFSGRTGLRGCSTRPMSIVSVLSCPVSSPSHPTHHRLQFTSSINGWQCNGNVGTTWF